MELKEWVLMFLAIGGFLFAFYKWIVIRNDKRRNDLRDAHQRALKDHDERLDRHSQRLQKIDELIGLTRAELHSSYAKLDRIEKLEANLDAKLERVHSRVTAVSRDVNKAIGQLQGAHDAEIAALIEKISNTLEVGVRGRP